MFSVDLSSFGLRCVAGSNPAFLFQKKKSPWEKKNFFLLKIRPAAFMLQSEVEVQIPPLHQIGGFEWKLGKILGVIWGVQLREFR